MISNHLQEKKILIWLYLSLFLLIILINIGGLTRLTDSGLSITKWEIITGIFPPLTDLDWNNYFDEYKKIPEYKKVNYEITLNEFKYIFWWEYIHRLAARVCVIFFVFPFLFFLFTQKLSKNEMFIGFSITFLYFFQGFIGWYMVQSGLIHNVDVSHFRLATHLVIAKIILCLTFFLILKIKFKNFIFNNFTYATFFFLFLIFVQIMLGAFVSGTDAGSVYQTWPLMGNDAIPNEIEFKNLIKNNYLYDIVFLQFIHRNFAYFIFFYFLIFFFVLKKKNIHLISANYVFLLIFIQIVLGIFTLTSGLNIFIASMHQLFSAFLLLSVIYLLFQVSLLKKYT
jgi:cytochrome c oxidase assembly protein subunit 15